MISSEFGDLGPIRVGEFCGIGSYSPITPSQILDGLTLDEMRRVLIHVMGGAPHVVEKALWYVSQDRATLASRKAELAEQASA